MKLKPIPTSPKMRDKSKVIREISAPAAKFDLPKKSKNGLAVLVVAILFGFLAGLLGEITISSLAVKYPDLPILGTLYLRMSSTPAELIIRQESKSISAGELAAQSMIADASGVVVSIFAKKEKDSNNSLATAYLDHEKLGNGIIITNDGLVMTTTNVVSDVEAAYVAILQDGSLLEAEEIIIDPTSHTAFFWIDSISNQVASFESETDIPLSSDNYILMNSTTGRVQVTRSQIEELSYLAISKSSDLIESSDRFDRLIKLAQNIEPIYEGAPVVRTNGKIIGLVFSEDYPEKASTVLPDGYAMARLEQFIHDKKAVRPKLGIHFVDLSRVAGLAGGNTNREKEGLLIIGDIAENIPALEDNSPALKKLEVGDIITNYNDQIISPDDYFTELIQLSEPGEKITLELLRNGIAKTITVTLEEM